MHILSFSRQTCLIAYAAKWPRSIRCYRK